MANGSRGLPPAPPLLKPGQRVVDIANGDPIGALRCREAQLVKTIEIV
jgi:hypothetical protein